MEAGKNSTVLVDNATVYGQDEVQQIDEAKDILEHVSPSKSNVDEKRSVFKEQSKEITTKEVGRWTTKEHNQFLEGLRIHGEDWRKIAMLVKTRSNIQGKFVLQVVRYGAKRKTHTENKKSSNSCAKVF